MQKKGVPEIQKFSSVQFSYEWFGLGFTVVGLPSLARRARVPADSATLVSWVSVIGRGQYHGFDFMDLSK